MIYTLLYYIILFLESVLLIRVVISWLQLEKKQIVLAKFAEIVDWALAPLRKVVPLYHWGIDFSPVIAFLVLDLIKRSLVY